MLTEKGPTSIVVKEEVEEELDPWALYLYSIKSPATKEKYLLRLGKFLVYLNFQGVLEDKARAFARKGKVDSTWAFNSILRFIQFQGMLALAISPTFVISPVALVIGTLSSLEDSRTYFLLSLFLFLLSLMFVCIMVAQ